MAVAFVQTAGSANASATTTVTATFGSSTTAGNCVVAVIGRRTTTAVTGVTLGGSAGNFAELTSIVNGSVTSIHVWADPSCAGGQTSVVATGSSNIGMAMTIYEFSGVAAASPLDQKSTGSGTSSTSFTSGATPTTTLGDEAWVGGACIPVTGTLTGPSSPWANEAQQASTTNVITLRSGFQVATSIGAATYSGTISTSTTYCAAVVTLLGIAAAALPSPPVVISQAVKRAAFY